MGTWGALLAGSLFLSACAGKGDRTHKPGVEDSGTYETDWAWPDCEAISGTDAVTFSDDDGATVMATPDELEAPATTSGLVALDSPGALAAMHDGALLRSADAGCTWTSLSLPSDLAWQPVAAPGGRVYAWTRRGDAMLSIAGDEVTELLGPSEEITGMVADPSDAEHLRAGGGDCTIYESWDGGGSWDVLNASPTSSLHAYTVAFDPADLDHAACTIGTDGLYTTVDAGARWDAGRGIAEGESVNVFTAVFTANSARIWAEGLRLETGHKAIWMSSDGGATFVSVLEEDEGISLETEVPLTTHPSAPDTVFFASGSIVYRYDAATGALEGNAPTDLEVDAMLASPAPLGILYLGLSEPGVDP